MFWEYYMSICCSQGCVCSKKSFFKLHRYSSGVASAVCLSLSPTPVGGGVQLLRLALLPVNFFLMCAFEFCGGTGDKLNRNRIATLLRR